MNARRQAAWLLLSMICATSMAFYVSRIWSAGQSQNFSDLYAPWWASHELLLHRRNPYSPSVAHEIQTIIYGAESPISPDDPTGIAGGFAYPPFTALLLWPLVHLPFSAAKVVFLVFSIFLVLMMLALWLRTFRYHLSPVLWAAAVFFVFGSFPVMQGLKLENLSVMAATLITVAVFCIWRDQLVLAGILSAFSTFKPQLAIGLVIWLLIWALGDWPRRQRWFWSFVATILTLGLVSEWLSPGWIANFLNVVRAYRHYTYGHSLFDVWFTPALGPVVSAMLLLSTVYLCWRYRRVPAGSGEFSFAISMLLAANLVVVPTLAPHAQLLVLPAFLGLARESHVLIHGSRVGRMLWLATILLLAWPWISTAGLLISGILSRSIDLQRFWQVPLYTSPILPLAAMLTLAVRLVQKAPLTKQEN